MSKDYYLILEIDPNASPEEIKEQYCLLQHAWHPDKFPTPSQKAKAEEKIKQINEAYTVLKSSQTRAAYDKQRQKNRENQAKPAASQTAPSPKPSTTQTNTAASSNPTNPQHLHYEFYATNGDVVEVELNSQANVLLMNDENYQRYQRGEQSNTHGGWVNASPVTLKVPEYGRWHVVVVRDSHMNTLQASTKLIRSWP